MVSSPQHAIYRSSGDGPTFSGGHDSNISNNANSHIGSYTNFHNSYCLISSGVQNTKTVLAGSYGLALNEVEVVYLTWVTWHREQIISDGVDFFSATEVVCILAVELKQNPNNLFLVPFNDQVESHIAFLLLCYALMKFTLSLSTKWTQRLTDLKMLQN